MILATEWDEFRNMDPEKAGELVKQCLILDARNVLPIDDWTQKGWRVQALGHGE